MGGSLELLRVLSFPVLTFHLLPSFQIVSLTMVGESAAPLPGTARGLTVQPSQDKLLHRQEMMFFLLQIYPTIALWSHNTLVKVTNDHLASNVLYQTLHINT